MPLFTTPSSDNELLYLKHDDYNGDNVLANGVFNVAGVIDWESAHKAGPAEAFNSPIGLLPVADLCGKGAITEDEAVLEQLLKGKGYG